MPLNPYRRSPTWDKITQLIEERNRKMQEVRRLYEEARAIDKLVSQLRANFRPPVKSESRPGPSSKNDDRNSAA